MGRLVSAPMLLILGGALLGVLLLNSKQASHCDKLMGGRHPDVPPKIALECARLRPSDYGGGKRSATPPPVQSESLDCRNRNVLDCPTHDTGPTLRRLRHIS